MNIRSIIIKIFISLVDLLAWVAFAIILTSITLSILHFTKENSPLIYSPFKILGYSSLFGLVIYLLKRKANSLKIQEILKNIKFTFSSIENINSKGFSITELNWDSSKKDPISEKEKHYYWDLIEDIEFSQDQNQLKIKLKKGNNLEIPHNCYNWYLFISKIPTAQFKSFDIGVLDEIYGQLKDCKICGAIAVIKGQCRHCEIETWSKKQEEEYENEIEYIKEGQLDFFATENEQDKIQINIEHFKKSPTWKLLVSHEEILNYSKEFNW